MPEPTLYADVATDIFGETSEGLKMVGFNECSSTVFVANKAWLKPKEDRETS